MGLLLGPGWAMLGGAVLSGPAVYHHEFLALPFNAALGLIAGSLGRFAEMDEIWSFTPFIDLSLLPLGAGQPAQASHQPPDS